MTRFEDYLYLNEATTSITEDMHEIFFAMSFASILTNQEKLFIEANTFDGYIFFLDKCGTYINNKEKTIKSIEKYLLPENEKILKNLKNDAIKVSKVAYKKILQFYNNKVRFISVERVFATGKKIISDSIVKVDTLNGKDEIGISLKYGQGQSNNLSPIKLINILYNLNLDEGILKTIYKTPHGKIAINNTLREYIKLYNDNNIDIGYNINQNTTWDQWNNKSNSKRNFSISKFYRLTTKQQRKNFLSSKKEIHESIERFLNSYNISDKLIDVIAYMLRSMDDKSVLYMAKGGAKSFWIPSKNALKNHNFNIETKYKNSISSYKKYLNIKLNNKTIIELDLNFRWQNGQFVGDYSQKGTKINIFEFTF